MKILVVCYSRTRNTKRVAEQIAKILGADLDEIEDGKNRKGIRGFLGGGRDAFMKNQTQIEFEKNPADYDLVILGTPVWVGTATPAVRTYATQNREVLRNKQVAFFCTFGGEAKNTFADLEEFLRPPKATLDLKDKRVRAETKEVEKEIEEFCGKLK